MRKLLMILLFFFCFDVKAETLCKGQRAELLDNIENNFQYCLLDFPKDSNNELMINITQDKIKCLQHVADDIFNAFYSSTREDKHYQFEKFIEAVQEQSYNLEIGSDLSKHWHTSSFYELGYINHAYVMIHNVVKDYISYMKQECAEIPDEAIEEMKDR